MADNVITIVGNLVDDPELRYTTNGVAVANARVAVNRRFRNNQTNEWEDRLDGYFTVNVWRDMAENVADTLHRGDRVLVQGRLQSRSYETKEGETRWVTEIEADEICPSLRWAKASVEKVRRGGGRGGDGGRPDSPPHPADQADSQQAQQAQQAPQDDDVPF